MARARVWGRSARGALDDDELRHLAGQLMRQMDTSDPAGREFARFAACVVEMSNAPPRQVRSPA
ncbi:hypothetical protein [Yinghuangia soli]|uniref:Uncharacterized protein n=1 Tax=Yinghuangia soli TaxID=2908204 RepID=A0AA41U160_9ACTN|nr:hypothetical protein [Yinghuangia soli]MCF2527177.1 hypothetical protein [Yinghuangia soli]